MVEQGTVSLNDHNLLPTDVILGVPTEPDSVNPNSNPPPRSPGAPERSKGGPRSTNAPKRGRRSTSDSVPPMDDWGPGPARPTRPSGGSQVRLSRE